MKTKVVGIREARNNFSDLIAWVMAGRKVIISRFNKPVAVLSGIQKEDNLFSLIKQIRKKQVKFLSQGKINALVEKIIAQNS